MRNQGFWASYVEKLQKSLRKSFMVEFTGKFT